MTTPVSHSLILSSLRYEARIPSPGPPLAEKRTGPVGTLPPGSTRERSAGSGAEKTSVREAPRTDSNSTGEMRFTLMAACCAWTLCSNIVSWFKALPGYALPAAVRREKGRRKAPESFATHGDRGG